MNPERKLRVKAIFLGVVVTKILYFVPIINIGAPLFGGAVTAYIINNGPWDGIKSGFLKGLAMVFPAIILGIFFTDILAAIPIIGNLLAGSLVLIVTIIVIHSITLGMIGGFISGGIAQRVRTTSVEGTAKATANVVNTATRATATATNTADDEKQTYVKERETNTKKDEIGENTGASDSTNKIGNNEKPPDSSQNTDVTQNTDISSSSATENNQSATETQSQESDSIHDTETAVCTQCSTTIPIDVHFCPECGIKSPTEPNESRKRAHNEHTGPRSEPSTPTQSTSEETDPVKIGAETILQQDRPESEVANQFCQVLSDPTADPSRIKLAIRNIVKVAENASEVSDAVGDLGDSPSTQQLRSAERRLSQFDGETAMSLVPIINHTIHLKTEQKQSQQKHTQYKQAAEDVCNAASRSEAVKLQSNGVDTRAVELANKINRGELVIETAESPLRSAVNEVERSTYPQTRRSRELLEGLKEGENSEVVKILQNTVNTIDEYHQLRSALNDITNQDVRRQLNSLDADLRQKDDQVYRHLADRVRELEAMLDQETIDDIQLYAIYQESRFYDRTLIPRLSRTNSSSNTIDVGKQIDDIESRTEAIRTEYINVRADHNHTIPNHFLKLVDSLCSRARRLEPKQPQQAIGVLAAAAELLGNIEQLYERNEYSVMLRRLRG